METSGINSKYLTADQKLALSARRQHSIARTILMWEIHCQVQQFDDAKIRQGVEQINMMDDQRLKKLRKSLASAAKVHSLITIDRENDKSLVEGTAQVEETISPIVEKSNAPVINESQSVEQPEKEAVTEKTLSVVQDDQIAGETNEPLSQPVHEPKIEDQSIEETSGTHETIFTKGESNCILYLKENADRLIAPNEIHLVLKAIYTDAPESTLKLKRWQFIKKLKSDSLLSKHFSVIGSTRATKYLWKSDPESSSTQVNEVAPNDEKDLEDTDGFRTLTDWGLKVKYENGKQPVFSVNGHEVDLPEKPCIVFEALINSPEATAKIHELFRKIRLEKPDFKYEKIESGLTFIRNVLASYGHQDKLAHELNGPDPDRKYCLQGFINQSGGTDFLVQMVST